MLSFQRHAVLCLIGVFFKRPRWNETKAWVCIECNADFISVYIMRLRVELPMYKPQ